MGFIAVYNDEVVAIFIADLPRSQSADAFVKGESPPACILLAVLEVESGSQIENWNEADEADDGYRDFHGNLKN